MKKVAAALVVLFALPVLVAGAASGGATSQLDRSALKDIPADFARLYVEAASEYGFEWQLLAAVGKVECDHGRGDCYRPNRAGARGPMQFLPATWVAYKSASGDPPYDIYDPRDAVFAAAAKLAADGIKRDPRAAIYSYNHSGSYIDEVIAWAVRYGWSATDAGVLAQAVLTHPNIELRPEARADIENRRVDGRVLAALLLLAAEHELSDVGPFVSGHSLYVEGTDRISNHTYGRAVDIPIVDGIAVSYSNVSARRAARSLLSLPAAIRPDELGSPWVFSSTTVTSFADEAHSNHLHAGWGANP